MIRLVFELLLLFGSAAQVVPLPGTPIAIQPVDLGVAVSCVNPSSICAVYSGSVLEVLPFKVQSPRGLCLWNDELVAADFAGKSIVTGNRVIPLPGNPDGISEVFWNSSSVPELAVALFEPGVIVLVQQDGTISTLLEMPGVKCLSSCDADGDDDMDIFASGCGSGVVFIENTGAAPVIHRIGTIQAGVKRCCAVDMNGDGFIDVAGIACAEGGAGWWENPGYPGRGWSFHDIDVSLEGPKDIFCRGDSMVIASLFSGVVFSFDSAIQLVEGFTCCFISDNGDVILGHRLGFLVTVSGNGGIL
ncbi:MAG: hypothetical protein K8S62_07180 [Candidatus Sabulitectum sp.]|nr:hypothetical protein [Candidatus Sabulitectum sp.]